jgi:septin family protein
MILYFLRGPRISEEDIKYMKRLQKYGNIIPVIAKGDAYSKEEVNEVKRLFFEKTNKKGLSLFDFESVKELFYGFIDVDVGSQR